MLNRIESNSFVKSPLHYLYMFIPSLSTSMTHYNPALQSLFERDYLMNDPPIDGNYTTMMKE